MKRLSNFILLVSLFYVQAFTQNLDYCNLEWKYLPNLENIGEGNILNYDIDNDGNPEIIYSSDNNNKGGFKILDHVNGEYQELYASNLFFDPVSWMEIHDLDGSGNPILYYSYGDTHIEKFDLNTLTQLDSITVEHEVEKFLIVNPSPNGSQQIVYANGSQVYISDFQGNTLFSEFFPSLDDFEVGNVDNDDNLELIISAYQSKIIDLTSLEEEWIYDGDFGKNIKLHSLNGNNYDNIFGAESYGSTINAYNAVSQSIEWQLTIDYQIDFFDILDLNNDNSFEIITNYSTFGLYAYDIDTQQQLWEYELQSSNVSNFSYDDFDNDGEKELAIGYDDDFRPNFYIINPEDQDIEWVANRSPESIFSDVGDYNQDGVDDIISVISRSNAITAYIWDGQYKTLIESFPLSSSFGTLKEVSIQTSNNQTYLLFVYGSWISIYERNSATFIINQNFGSNTFTFGRFLKNPNLIHPTICTGNFNGEIKLFEIIDNLLVNRGTIPEINEIARHFEFGDFDNNDDLELAILRDGFVQVFDFNSLQLEKEFEVNFYATKSFAIEDVNFDGIKEVVYYNGLNNIRQINYETANESFLFNAPSGEVTQFLVKNLDSNPAKEIVLLGSTKLFIYSPSGNLLYESPEINGSLSTPRDFLLDFDLNQDGYKDLIISTRYGIFEFKLEEIYADFELPRILDFSPDSSNTQLSTNVNIEILFSETINQDSLENHISIVDQSNTPLSFEIAYDEASSLATISPLDQWSPNNKITVLISSLIPDLNGNNLDGNNNGVYNQSEDNSAFYFYTGAGIDNIGPEINDVTIQNNFYQGLPIEISGYASDSSDIASSLIENIEYFIDQTIIPGTGVILTPEDGFYDEIKEEFSISIPTQNLSAGTHQISILAKDLLGNYGNIFSGTFELIVPNPANWTTHSFDLLNTAYYPFSNNNPPLRLNYEIEHNEIFYQDISKGIIVNDKLIYSITTNFSNQPDRLFCRDVHTGAILWENQYFILDEIPPAAFAYGKVFVQLNNSGNSKLICLNIEDGSQEWEVDYSIQWQDDHGPLIYKDFVIIENGYTTTKLSAYKVQNGDMAWSTTINSDKFESWLPAIYNDTLYAYTDELVALNPNNGATHYEISSDDIPIGNQFSIMRKNTVMDTLNRQLLLTSQKYLHAFSLDSKTINWTSELETFGNNFQANIAISNNVLYIGTSYDVRAYNASTGEILWMYEIDSFEQSAGYYLMVNDYIVVFSNYQKTYLLNKDDGELIEKLPEAGDFSFTRDYLIIFQNDMEKLAVYEFFEPPFTEVGIHLDSLKTEDCFTNEQRPEDRSLSNQQKEDTIKVFPNITSDFIFLQTDGILEEITIRLFNQNGQELKVWKNQGWSKQIISLSHLPKGSYYISINNAQIKHIEKIIRQ